MSRQGAFREIYLCSAVSRCHETQARELAHLPSQTAEVGDPLAQILRENESDTETRG